MLYLHQFSLSLWIGTGAFGLFMSSVFPTTLALAEYYIDVTGKAVANKLKSDFAFFETSGRLSQVALFVKSFVYIVDKTRNSAILRRSPEVTAKKFTKSVMHV